MPRKIKVFLFICWFVAITVPLTYAMMKHDVPFREPASARVAKGLSSLGIGSSDSWRLIHFIATDCGCSRSIIDHLLSRGVTGDELVFLIGPSPEEMRARLVGGGFTVRLVASADVSSRLGISGVPWLLILNPHGDVMYSGGYSDRLISRASVIDEIAWLRELQAGRGVVVRPAFGCAIAQGFSRVLRAE